MVDTSHVEDVHVVSNCDVQTMIAGLIVLKYSTLWLSCYNLMYFYISIYFKWSTIIYTISNSFELAFHIRMSIITSTTSLW